MTRPSSFPTRSPKIAEPTFAEYKRYFELGNSEENPTKDEIREAVRLEPIVRPWLFSPEYGILALKKGDIIPVLRKRDDDAFTTVWITDEFTIVPEHHCRPLDGYIALRWALIPLECQAAGACAIFFENGKFVQGSAEEMGWHFSTWIYHWGQGHAAYKRHFGREYCDSDRLNLSVIESWIAELNSTGALDLEDGSQDNARSAVGETPKGGASK